MPVIPEETIDHVLDRVNDAIDTVRILTQALNVVAETVADHGKLLVGIHAAVTHKNNNDTLSKLLAEIAETGRANHELLRKLVAKP